MAVVDRAEYVSYVYELVESNILPALDLSQSLGSAWCSAYFNWKHAANPASSSVVPLPQEEPPPTSSICETRLQRLSNVGYAVGLVLCALTPCLSVKLGQSTAIASTVLVVPNMAAKLMLIRYNILKLLVRSYDFWYSVAISTATCVLLAIYFNDARGVMVLIQWMGNLNGAVVDANTKRVRHSVIASTAGGIVNMHFAFFVQCQLIDAAKDFEVIRYGKRVVFARDVIVNGFATSAIMLLRCAIRRFVDLKQQQQIQCTLLRCVNYRCTAKLQPRNDSTVNSRRIAAITEPHQRPRYPSNQLLFVKVDSVYDASRTFYPLQLHTIPWSRAQRFTLAVVGHVGIGCSVVGFLDSCSVEQRQWLFGVGLACTLCCVIITWSISQTELVRDIVTSFDFLFLSFQITSAQLCACDMFYWDARCLGLLSFWLWVHFVLTTDALTPVVRHKIAFYHRYLILPVLLFIAGQIWITYELVVDVDGKLQDRKIHEFVLKSRIIEIRTVPFFFSRLAISFIWSLRILWRLAVSRADDAVLLRGKVAYVYLTATPLFPAPPTSTLHSRQRVAPRKKTFSRLKS